MAVYKQKGSNNWWFKFTWNGEQIRESTKQANKRVAEQIEAARRTALAKGEVGIREPKRVPTLREFAEKQFLPSVRATFQEKRNTRRYYEVGLKALLAFDRLAAAKLDEITGETISAYVLKRQGAGLKVSSINRELQVLRRMFAIARDEGITAKALARVRMIPGEAHRERVLTADEEAKYLKAASDVGDAVESAYFAAQRGIRASRGAVPVKLDSYRLRDATTILIDCGLRPEECFRLRWENIHHDHVEILFGKTMNARRRIPVSPRVAALLDMRRSASESEWAFPAPTRRVISSRRH
jgi:integrase